MSKETLVPKLDTRSFLRYLWRQLTSMSTALILLLLLGIASIPGSLIPQRTQNPIQVSEYFQNSPARAQWMDRFFLFDVYGSPWFSAIYILLFISLIGCVFPRSIAHLKAARALPPATPKILDRLEFFTTWQGTTGDLERAQKWLKSKRFRIIEAEGSISAEKGYLRETGNLFFHLALILILVGVSFSSLFGARGEAIISVGERFINMPTSYDSLALGKLFNENNLTPFTIEVDKFYAKYNVVTNRPEDYTLNVSVSNAPGSVLEKRVVKVNSPLTFGSTRVFLQATGYSPIVTVRDSQGNIALAGPIPFLPQDLNLRSIGAIKVPDAIPQVGFVATFLPTQARIGFNGAISIFPEVLDPKLLFSIWRGDLGLDSGIPQSVYRLDTSKLERIALKSLKPGETFNYPDGSITFEGVVPWVNLQFVRDPGKGYALLGGIGAILGLLASLFTRQRRIWVRVSDSGVVKVAGLAKNGAPGLEVEIAELVKALKRGM